MERKARRWQDTKWGRGVGTGPIDFDIEMALSHGWSDEQIQRVSDLLAKVAMEEWSLSHADGPVQGCPCYNCSGPTVRKFHA